VFDHDLASILTDALGRPGSSPRPASRAEQLIADREARDTCKQEGHRYRVHGRANPTKVDCKRCRVTWAIGPRTEPR